MAYSGKIHDPCFDRYIKGTRDYRFLFAFLLAAIVVLVFYVYGQNSSEMDNPEALYVGLVIGVMFVFIGIYAAFSGKKVPTWDGVVVKKDVIENNHTTLFVVYIEDHKRQKHEIAVQDDKTLYNYYKIGEKVRYHGKLKTYEKFDKSADDIIFCNACSYMNDIKDRTCVNCGCVLLK